MAARSRAGALSHRVGAGGWRRVWRGLRRLVKWGAVVSGIGVAAVLGWALWVEHEAQPLIYAPDAAGLPVRPVALVFGAGLNREGGPSAVLYDRVAAAVQLYRAGKVRKLLMSGDNSSADYNEVAVMRQTALDLGAAAGDIVLDYAGFRTYDSCYRARDVFGLRELTLVTNRYHLPRALYTCRALGLDAVGVNADPPQRVYSALRVWQAREVLALAAAWWDVQTGARPTFLGPPVDVDDPPVQP